jgi:DNA-binding MurR/RpiR family transcriptional regulator
LSESQIADRVREQWQLLTKSDRMVARRLLADYPIAGLKTLAELAARAGVSAPTVIRCVKKLGFQSYPDFQSALHDEVQSSFEHVIAKASDKTMNEQDLDAGIEAVLIHSVHRTVSLAQHEEINELAELIARSKSSVLCFGGRVSQAVAMIFQAHLLRLRRRVELVSTNPIERAERLMDVSKNDVVVVFDFSPYDPQSQSFAQLAAERKAIVVCFTDFDQSPVTENAHVVICAENREIADVPSLTAALCVVEIVLDQVGKSIGSRARSRRRSLVGPDLALDLNVADENA